MLNKMLNVHKIYSYGRYWEQYFLLDFSNKKTSAKKLISEPRLCDSFGGFYQAISWTELTVYISGGKGGGGERGRAYISREVDMSLLQE